MDTYENKEIEQQTNQKFFCLELYSNVTKGNFATFLFVSFATIVFFVFIDSSLSYVLTNYLDVPSDKTGTALGTIVFWNEVVIIFFSAFWGILSDKIGRRWVYVIGAILMTVGMVLPPFATSLMVLLFFRLIFSPGAAATSSMLVALLADYPRDDGMNKARGKASGFMGLAAGLGAVTALFFFLRIPSLLKGMDAKEAGRYMFLAVGILGVITIIISFIGLQKNQIAKAHTHESFWQIIVGGLKATSNPIIVLSYISSFAARGDSVIVSSFLPTFIQNYGIKYGIDSKEALTRAGEVAGIVQTFALVFAPIIGIIADKVNRVFLMLIVSILSCVGYAMFGLIQDPYNWSFSLFLAITTVGIGEMGILVMCQSLLAQNAPDSERGSVSGFFALTGSIGIMIATSVGGYLFDSWREGAPFIIFSIFNGIVVLYSAVLIIYQLYKGTFGPLIYKSNRGYCLVDTQPKMETTLVNEK